MIITIDFMYVLEILGIGFTMGVLTFVSMIFFDIFASILAKWMTVEYDRKFIWVLYSLAIVAVAGAPLVKLILQELTQLDMKAYPETVATFCISAITHIAITGFILKVAANKEIK